MRLPRRNDARLANWQGPVFPSMVEELGVALSRWSGTPKLDDVMRVLPGYDGAIRLQTSDGYLWPAALKFYVGSGMVIVALPRGRDRSPAAYYSDNSVSPKAIEAVVARVAKALGYVAADRSTQSQ